MSIVGAGLLWSALEVHRLAGLGLLSFTSIGTLLLFVMAHAGLCVLLAAGMALVGGAPRLLGARQGLLALWLWALGACLVGAGVHLSLARPPWAGVAAALLAGVPLSYRAAGDLCDPRPGHAPLYLGAGAAAALANQAYLPMQLLHLHGALSLLGLGLLELGLACLPPPAGLRRAGAALLLLSPLSALLGWRCPEVRFALGALGQESRAALHLLTLLPWHARRAAPIRPPQEAGQPVPCGHWKVRRVVLITIDSLRADRLPIYGYPRPTAPNLTALASRAVVFVRAHAGAPSTSRAVRRLFAVRSDAASPLGEALRRAGLHAEAVLAARLTRYFGPGTNRTFQHLHAVPVAHDVLDRPVARQAEEVIAAGGPGLVWIHLASPHQPYLRWPDGPDFGPRPSDRYDGEVFEADRALGRILQAIARHPLASQTAVVVSADHGEELLDHGGVAHGRDGLFEEEMRVPLLLAVPGCPPRRVEHPVSHDDLAPTLAALLGACGPGSVPLPGRSLLPALEGDDGLLPTHPLLLGPYPPLHGGALIEGRWKLAFLLRYNAFALYDLEADPRERRNLIVLRPEVAGPMQTRLRRALGAPSSP